MSNELQRVIKWIVGIALVVFLVSLGVVIARGNFIDNILNLNNYEEHEYKYEIKEEYTDEDFNKLIVKAKDGPILIEKSETDKITVSVKYDKENQFTVSNENGNLEIKDNTKWPIFSFGFFTNSNRSYITITVPEEIVDKDFDIHTSNSYINVKDVNFKSLDISSTNGALSLNDVNITEDIDMNTSNGKIKIEDVIASSINADTSNGRINVENVNVENKITLDSSNGKIEVSDVTGKFIKADTSNASIRFDNVYVDEVILDTSNGDLTFINDDMTYQIKVIEYDTSNGEIEIKVNYDKRRR